MQYDANNTRGYGTVNRKNDHRINGPESLAMVSIEHGNLC